MTAFLSKRRKKNKEKGKHTRNKKRFTERMVGGVIKKRGRQTPNLLSINSKMHGQEYPSFEKKRN
jgi:hypothetical protein